MNVNSIYSNKELRRVRLRDVPEFTPLCCNYSSYTKYFCFKVNNNTVVIMTDTGFEFNSDIGLNVAAFYKEIF
jgi:hypothetical protein